MLTWGYFNISSKKLQNLLNNKRSTIGEQNFILIHLYSAINEHINYLKVTTKQSVNSSAILFLRLSASFSEENRPTITR